MWLGKGLGQICSSSPQLGRDRVMFQFPERHNSKYNQKEVLLEDRKKLKKDIRNEREDSDVKMLGAVVPKGFLNLTGFLLFLFNLRCLLWLAVKMPPVVLPSWKVLLPERVPVPKLLVLLFPLQAVLVTLNVERFSRDGSVPPYLVGLTHMATIFSTFAIPVFYLRTEYDLEGLLMNVLVTVTYLVLAMKLFSFILVHPKERDDQCNKNTENQIDMQIRPFFLYLMSPSIVYKPNPMKKNEIKSRRILNRVLEIALLSFGIKALFVFISLVTAELLDSYQKANICVVLDR